MTLLDYSELSKDECAALPCVCCGNPFGEIPGGGGFGICQFCWWEDCSVQFKFPWVDGGPNRVSLWHARRNYALVGLSDGLDRPDLWRRCKTPLPKRYCWGLDRNSYTDHSGGYDETCPFLFARDVLRAGGYFSYRQIRQKMTKLEMALPINGRVRMGHQQMQLSSDRSGCMQVDVDGLSVQSCHEYIRKLAVVTREHLTDIEASFENTESDTKSTVRFTRKSVRENPWDPHEYWFTAEFDGMQLDRLLITASADGLSPFVDLDKDVVKQ